MKRSDCPGSTLTSTGDGADRADPVPHAGRGPGGGGDSFALGEPKTEKSRRTLALPAATITVLKAHRTKEIERQLAAPVWLNEWDLAITGDQGAPLSGRMVRYEFQDLLKQAGITGPRIQLHDLRHEAVTYMLAQGVPMKVVQEVRGIPR